jgi:hypothetical protein
LIWRDGHSNSIGYIDFQWIKEFNLQTRINKSRILVLPSSYMYSSAWHDQIPCNNKYVYRAPIAGELQFCDFRDSVSDSMISVQEYVKSFGIPFIISKKLNTLPLLEILRNIKFAHYDTSHPDIVNNRKKMYRYGIDEYILSTTYIMKEYRDITIYNHSHWLYLYIAWGKHFGNTLNPVFVSFAVLVYYLFYNNEIKLDDNDWFGIIDKIEKLRNKNTLKNDVKLMNFFNDLIGSTNPNDAIEKFGVFLSIFPNKYHIQDCVFNRGNLGDFSVSIRYFFQNLLEKKIDKEILKNYFKIVLANTSKYNIYCSNTSVMHPFEWCIEPYLIRKNQTYDKINCPKEYYSTGFYDDDAPNDKVIMRTPKDIKYIFQKVGKYDITTSVYGMSEPININDIISGKNNYYSSI